MDAYLYFVGNGFDVKAGQFVEEWGIADTFNPIDVLNRRDLATDFFDPTPRGELGGRVRVALPGGGVIGQPMVSAYAMPLFRRTEFPTARSRYDVALAGARLAADEAERPNLPDAALFALRLDHTLNTPAGNADLKYLGARYPSRLPTIGTTVNADGQLLPEYFGVHMVAGGFGAVPNAAGWSKFTLKAEVAYKAPFALDGVALTAADDPDDYVQYVAGFDRLLSPLFTTTDQMTLTAEYLGESGANDPSSAFRLFKNDVAVRLAYEFGDFARSALDLRSIIDLDHSEWIAEVVVQRQLRFLHDDLQLQLSGRWMEPSSSSLLGAFPNNSAAVARLQWDY